MKQEPKTFTACINGFHFGNTEMIPDKILGKNITDFDPDEWISYICLLHTKALRYEKEIEKLKSINEKLTQKLQKYPKTF